LPKTDDGALPSNKSCKVRYELIVVTSESSLVVASPSYNPGHSFNMVPAPDNSKRIEEAQKLAKTDTPKAEAIYKDILTNGPGSGDAALRDYEAALMGLGEIYRDTKRANELADLVRTSRSVLSSFARAKTAKLG